MSIVKLMRPFARLLADTDLFSILNTLNLSLQGSDSDALKKLRRMTKQMPSRKTVHLILEGKMSARRLWWYVSIRPYRLTGGLPLGSYRPIYEIKRGGAIANTDLNVKPYPSAVIRIQRRWSVGMAYVRNPESLWFNRAWEKRIGWMQSSAVE